MILGTRFILGWIAAGAGLFAAGCASPPPPVILKPEKMAVFTDTVRKHEVFGATQHLNVFLKDGLKWRDEGRWSDGEDRVVVFDGRQVVGFDPSRPLMAATAIDSIYETIKLARYDGIRQYEDVRCHRFLYQDRNGKTEILIDVGTEWPRELWIETKDTQVDILFQTILFPTNYSSEILFSTNQLDQLVFPEILP